MLWGLISDVALATTIPLEEYAILCVWARELSVYWYIGHDRVEFTVRGCTISPPRSPDSAHRCVRAGRGAHHCVRAGDGGDRPRPRRLSVEFY